MMFCEKCGKQINDSALFCPYCGQTTVSNSLSNKANSSPSVSKRGFNKKLLILIPAVIVIIVVFLHKSSSIGKELKGYWSASYGSDGNTYINQLRFSEGKSGLECTSLVSVKDNTSETIFSDSNSFSGTVIIDESTSSILIQNASMGATMRLHYKKSGGEISLYLEKYWCNGGDPFINNNPPINLNYSKIK